MSIFSDWKHGAISDEEFEMECIAYNNRARAEEEEYYRDLYEQDEEGDEEE